MIRHLPRQRRQRRRGLRYRGLFDFAEGVCGRVVNIKLGRIVGSEPNPQHALLPPGAECPRHHPSATGMPSGAAASTIRHTVGSLTALASAKRPSTAGIKGASPAAAEPDITIYQPNHPVHSDLPLETPQLV